MLENLYWTRASQTDSTESYQAYLSRYANGPHAAAASKRIEDLKRTADENREAQKKAEDEKKENQRFQEALNSSDEATLRAFLKEYPSGPQRDQIYGRLDEVIWRKTQQGDVASLRAYVEKMSDGKYVSQAREEIKKLTEPQQSSAQNPQVDERKALLAVLDQYKRAYESQSIEELKNVWPGISDRAERGMQTLFKTASSLRLDYGKPEPQVAGDVATISFVQNMSYVLDRKPVKAPPAKVTMQLRKQSSGVWVIESIR